MAVYEIDVVIYGNLIRCYSGFDIYINHLFNGCIPTVKEISLKGEPGLYPPQDSDKNCCIK